MLQFDFDFFSCMFKCLHFYNATCAMCRMTELIEKGQGLFRSVGRQKQQAMREREGRERERGGEERERS